MIMPEDLEARALDLDHRERFTKCWFISVVVGTSIVVSVIYLLIRWTA